MKPDWYTSFNTAHECLLFISFPITCFFLVIIFKHIRRKFPIQVNCWFCNKNTALSYNAKNSFTCPHCQQYNGFTEAGDYNKIIPEQRDELLNHIVTPRKLRTSGATNGLCQICNNNQQLKIYQLANFVPMCDDNYDMEIEHFEKQLEKAYKLCGNCNFIVKSTISKRNGALLGKQIEEIRKSGLTLLNKSTVDKQQIIKVKKFILYLLSCAALCIGFLFKKECLVLIDEYRLELAFAVVGSFLTKLFIHLTATPTTSIINTKTIKQEKFSPVQEKKSKSRLSTSNGNVQQSSDGSGADLSYASFNSPLNSTVRSEDGGSVCSELERLTSNMNRSGNNEYSTSSNSFVLRKSPSAPSIYSSFHNVSQNMSHKPALNLDFQQLCLGGAHQSSFTPIGEPKRPILSPAKFRNPWTGKPWDVEVSSRSSSQSSGVYSRATSIYGDDVASVTSENLFKSNVNSIPMHKTCSNNYRFEYMDVTRNSY